MSEEHFQEGQVWKESDYAEIPICHSQKLKPKIIATKNQMETSTPKKVNKKRAKNTCDAFNNESEMIIDSDFETPKTKVKPSTEISWAPKKKIIVSLK